MLIIKDIIHNHENIPLFRAQLLITGEYLVKDGYIALKPFSGNKKYNPFNYYQEYETATENSKQAKEPVLSKAIVEDILGKWVKDLQLHTLFASLENDEQVIKWVNYFGLPFYKEPETQKNIPPWLNVVQKEVVITDIFTLEELRNNTNHKIGRAQMSLFNDGDEKDPVEEEIEVWNETVFPIRISRVLEEAKELKTIMDLHRAIIESDYKKMEDILVSDDNYKQIILLESIPNEREIEMQFNDSTYKIQFKQTPDFMGHARNKIERSLIKNLSEVRHIFAYPSSNWDWEFPNLLSAMYLMTYLDFKVGKMPIKCKRKKCSIYFVPARGDKVYCSKKCREDDNLYRFRQKGKQIDSNRDKEGRTPLMRAIMEQDLDKFDDLITITKGINLNKRDKKGMTALHYTVLYCTENISMVEEVLGKRTNKVNIHKKDYHGNTAMDLAIELNKKNICELIKKEIEARKYEKRK